MMSEQRTMNASPVAQLADRLISDLSQMDRLIVAFSGGVDSAVVAYAAHRALGDRARAVMAISPSVPSGMIELAKSVASEIGIELCQIETSETERSDYLQNDGQRCFYCKQTLYDALSSIARKFCDATIASGTNASDLGDYRPGISAGRQAGVETPLADLGISKQQVRELARFWKLSIWDLPAGPCLASRVAFGEPITVQRLKMIDEAESWFHDAGYRDVRVRLHANIHARIEVPPNRIAELVSASFREIMNAKLRAIGFEFISVDTEGLRSGSFNNLVSLGPVDTAQTHTDD